jgi:cytochrome c oxidase subunit III
MRERPAYDAAQLPLHGAVSASVTWWGTMAFMLIEGAGFALAIAVYLYFYSIAPQWPLAAPPPNLGPGTWLTAVLLVSLVPNWLVWHWAGQEDLRKVQIGMLVMSLFGIAPLVLRVFEFPALHIWWDSNAYGSVTWLMLGLHTTHLITDLGDTLVLAVIMFTRHGDNRRRYGDVQDNALYWGFVVLTWLPIYCGLYWIPRL